MSEVKGGLQARVTGGAANNTAGESADFTLIIPTRNEAPNIEPLITRIVAAVTELPVELLFIDDSDDDTVATIESVARQVSLSVRVIHRPEPRDGLGGAVVAGMEAATTAWVIVMDADLQHPPEQLPRLIAATGSASPPVRLSSFSSLGTGRTHPRNEPASRPGLSGVDIVVGSRFVSGGSAEGLAGPFRVFLSGFSTRLVKVLFPRRLRQVTDPMSGLFAVRIARVRVAGLHPRGFKILLEILVRNSLRLAEVPATLAPREAGESKADVIQGWRLTRQITRLRFAMWFRSGRSSGSGR